MTSMRRVLVCLMAAFALAAFALPALADSGDKFSAVMSPTSPPAQAGPIAFTATIKNLARFDYLKSYTITVPAGLAISGIPTASSGSVSVSGQVVSVSGVLVAYNRTTQLTINATPASTLGCGSSALLWGATAKGGFLVGNEVFALDSTSVLQTTVTSLCYTLTYGAGSGGSIIGTTPQTVSPGGSGSAVTAQANALYSFASWSDGVLTAARTDTNVTGNINVTANFVPNTLTITNNPKPASAAVNVAFAVNVVTSPGAPAISMNSDCGATSTSTSSGNSTTFSVTISTVPPSPGVCNLTFSATNYPSAPLSVKVLADQVSACAPPSGPPPAGSQFTASCAPGGINVTGFAAGVRGPNKAGACDPLNFTLTNNICGAVIQQDANGNFIPPNAVSFVWDQSTQTAAFTYTVTWKAEYVDPSTGLPFAQRTKYCIGTDPSLPCGDVNNPADPNRVTLQACTSPLVAYASIPSGQPACSSEEGWEVVLPGDPAGDCSSLTPPTNPAPACVRVTTTIIDARDPPIIRD